MNELIKIGASNPVDYRLSNGMYLIVSDSHGKHTTRGMFRLLNKLNEHFKFKNIIHIGHAVDDDNDISYLWQNFNNLIMLAKDEQRQQIEKRKQNYGYKVVNGNIYINGLRICNQDVVKDYSKSSINLMDSYLYQQDCIFNGHKHQLINKGCYNRSLSYYCSGCICEPHIITTVKQIDFKDGRQIKQSYPTSFVSYRNRKHLLKYWEQGLIIVQAFNNNYSVHPIRVKKVDNEYATSYYDKIFTETKIVQPDNKIFFNSDFHVSMVDMDAFGLQQQFVKKYSPNIYVNLGDMVNYKSLNHHELEKCSFIDTQFMKQFTMYCEIMKKINNWCSQKHIIFGNHERFMNDFTSKYPQLKTLFNFLYESPIKQFNFIPHGLKTLFDVHGLKFLHGDLKLYGQSGSYLDKISKTFGSDTIVGHLHVNEIKKGCYIVGLTGLYNQQYNDVCGSRWQQGFGFTNQYKGVNFTQLISFPKYEFSINRIVFNKNKNSNCNLDTQLKLITR